MPLSRSSSGMGPVASARARIATLYPAATSVCASSTMRRSTRTSWQIMSTFRLTMLRARHLPVQVRQLARYARLPVSRLGQPAQRLIREVAGTREHVLNPIGEGGRIGGLHEYPDVG